VATIKKEVKRFSESTSSTQTVTMTLPGLNSIKSITVDTGVVSYKVNGSTVTLTLSGGSYSRRAQTGGSYVSSHTKEVSTSQTSSTNSFPSSVSYNSDGYSGTLGKDGSATQKLVNSIPGRTKTVSTERNASSPERNSCEEAYSYVVSALPDSISYNQGGYSGTLRLSSRSIGNCKRRVNIYWIDSAIGYYSGTVSEPSTNVYNYTQNYRGSVTKPGYDTRTYTYYYQYAVTVEYSDNSNPSIVVSTASNQVLNPGSKILLKGTATDIDNGNVVGIKYQVNNGPIKTLHSAVSNGTAIAFTSTLTFKDKRLYDGTVDVTNENLAENIDHRINIWAEDDQGGKSETVLRNFRVILNRPPVISVDGDPQDKGLDLGEITTPPTVKYSVFDPDGDKISIVEGCEKTGGGFNVFLRDFKAEPNKTNEFQLDKDTWSKLQPSPAQYSLVIKATDNINPTVYRNVLFKRKIGRIEYFLKEPFVTDIAAKRILITLDAVIPNGAEFFVKVTNNAFDESPVWEDITANVIYNRGYAFKNQAKSSDKWGIGIHMVFRKGTATQDIILRGFGGAFD